jgi:type I restriction-modification system DNA methylase subunit
VFPPKFATIQLSDAAISAVGEILAGSDFSNASQDIKGLAYEEMIRNTFDKGDNQQFFTPAPIVEFLVAALADRMRNAVVCDPASGTGGFLVEVIKANVSPSQVIGFEIDERRAWVTVINLFVHGAEAPQCYCYLDGGTLGSAALEHKETLDVIVTNPPFGSDFADQPALSRFVLGQGKQSRRRGILFIERCLELLRPGGWLGIVIDEGVLSLPSAADVRQLILQKAELIAVVSLPETAFMPYASVNTSILILRKADRPSQSQLTFYAKAENVGRKPNGDVDTVYLDDGTSRPNSDLPEILSAWRTFMKSGTLERQTDSIFLSNPKTWDAQTVATDTRLDFQFHHPSRIAAENALESCAYPLRSLGEICEVRNETYVPSVDFQDQVIPYTGLAHIEAHTGHALQVPTPANSLTSGVRRYQAGDILFARMRPSLRKVALIEFAAAGFASAECVVLGVKKDKAGRAIVDPYLLAELLRSDYSFGQIIHLIAGIGRPRINLKDLLSMKIPIPPHEHQAAIRQALGSLQEKYTALRLEAKRLSEAAKRLEADATATVAQSFLGQG